MNLTSKIMTKAILSILFAIAGYAILSYVDWRIALGVGCINYALNLFISATRRNQ